MSDEKSLLLADLEADLAAKRKEYEEGTRQLNILNNQANQLTNQLVRLEGAIAQLREQMMKLQGAAAVPPAQPPAKQ